MKIHEIHIGGFGTFAGRHLTGFGSGVNVLYGANEAGKTTILEFIRRILFGFPKGKQAAAFNSYEPVRGGKMGGKLVCQPGEGPRVVIERTDGSKGGPVSISTDSGGSVRQDLPALLGNASKEIFHNIYAFTLDELTDFGTLSGDQIKSRIYGAGLGVDIKHLMNSVKEIEKRAEEIFKPRGSNQEISRLYPDMKEIEKKIEDTQNELAEYDQKDTHLETLDKELAELAGDLKNLQTRQQELKDQKTVYPDWKKMEGVPGFSVRKNLLTIDVEIERRNAEAFGRRIKKMREDWKEAKDRLEEHRRQKTGTAEFAGLKTSSMIMILAGAGGMTWGLIDGNSPMTVLAVSILVAGIGMGLWGRRQKKKSGESRESRLKAESEQAKQKLEEAETEWRGWLKEKNLDPGLTPDEISEAFSLIDKLQGVLRGRKEEDFDRFLAALKNTDPEKLNSGLQQVAGDLKNLNDKINEKNQQIGETRNELSRLSSNQDLSARLGELEIKKQLLREYAEEWAICQIALKMLEDARKEYEREKQPEVLRLAQGYFAKVTDGKYPRIIRPLDSDEIFIEDEARNRLGVVKMSRGTREQLYLSMRLGLIEQYEKKSEPLPVVMDDVLVNFDDRRRQRMAEVLVEFARDRQVIILSCHAASRDLYTGLGARPIEF